MGKQSASTTLPLPYPTCSTIFFPYAMSMALTTLIIQFTVPNVGSDRRKRDDCVRILSNRRSRWPNPLCQRHLEHNTYKQRVVVRYRHIQNCLPAIHQISHSFAYYAALLPRRGPHIASHSVCSSVCLSVRPVIERHVAPPSELQ